MTVPDAGVPGEQRNDDVCLGCLREICVCPCECDTCKRRDAETALAAVRVELQEARDEANAEVGWRLRTEADLAAARRTLDELGALIRTFRDEDYCTCFGYPLDGACIGCRLQTIIAASSPDTDTRNEGERTDG